jgi:hypothetical protein
MATLAKIAEFISILSENFKGSPSGSMARIIGEKLKPFSDSDLAQGLDCLLSTRKYSGFPTLAEILEAVQNGSQQDLWEMQAEKDFGQVLRLPNDVYGNPRKAEWNRLSPIAKITLRQMGGNTDSWTNANLDFKRKIFFEIYMRLIKNPDKIAELEYIPQDKPKLKMVQAVVKDLLTTGESM